MKTLLAVLPLLLVAACATSTPPDTAGSASVTPVEKRVTDAATTPLTDLNIVRAKIPPVLQEARRDPYKAPADQGCAALGSDVLALDAALGADLDAPRNDANPSLLDRLSEAGESAAVGAIRGAAEGVVPFRGWVRQLTGAERRSREVVASVVAGGLRRAYLKGIAQSLGCAAPPAPLRVRPAQ